MDIKGYMEFKAWLRSLYIYKDHADHKKITAVKGDIIGIGIRPLLN